MTVSLFSGSSESRRSYLYIGIILAASFVFPYVVKTAFSYKALAEVTQRQLIDSQRQVAQEEGARAQLGHWQSVSEQWKTLAEHADGLGWRTSLWDVRSVEVDSKRYSRHETDVLISSLESSHDSFMLPQTFSITLAGNAGSLFIPSSVHDQSGAVQLSLSGDYYSRRVQ